MQKNRLFIVLAFLNCAHTTHAVEKSENMNMQQADQGNGQESLDALAQQLELQNLRIFVENKENRGNVRKDASIQREAIIQKMYEHQKNALPPGDPLWSFYEKLIEIRREIVDDLRNQQRDRNKSLLGNVMLLKFPHMRFDDKIREWADSKKINGIKGQTVEKTLRDVKQTLPILHEGSPGYVPKMDLLVSYPTSSGTTKLFEQDSEQDRLARKCQGIAEQRLDLYRKVWAHDLNTSIKGGYWNPDKVEPGYWEPNKIGPGIQKLCELSKETGREIKKTILNTIRNNLSGEDQDLKEKTIRLLKKDPVLTQMIKLDVQR